MATLVIHHLSSETHPSSQKHADIHFALVPLGWIVIGRRQGAELLKRRAAFTLAEQRNTQTVQADRNTLI